jgi:hypothetical protein
VLETDDDVDEEIAEGAHAHSYNRFMDAEDRGGRLRSFLVGGLLGASAVIAAARRKRSRPRQVPTGLAAFESAPCFRETLEREATRADGSRAER